MTPTHKRYILIELESQSLINWKIVYLKLVRILKDLFGEFGLAQIELRSITSRDNRIIIRCRREEEHKLRCAVLMLTSINGDHVKAMTLRVSGTLKGLKRILSKGSK